MKSPTETGGAVRDFDGTSGHSHYKPAPPPKQRIYCLSFRACTKNTLQGFADLSIGFLTIKGCALHSKGDRRWLNFPAKQYTDDTGAVQWQNLIVILEKAAFQKAALVAIDSFRAAPGKEDAYETPF